jgi:hypothetical protein
VFGEAPNTAPEAGALPKPPLKQANALNISTEQSHLTNTRVGVLHTNEPGRKNKNQCLRVSEQPIFGPATGWHAGSVCSIINDHTY